MHVIKPSWVVHPDDSRPSKPDLTLYSLDVHPDGSRLATGGLDSIIRIWSTAPILSPDAEHDDNVPRLLSTLSSHTGPVMSVRWSNGGSFLASGSDDRVVMIWAHDGSGGGKVWGSETTNIENWKATRRLVGHNSDVAGVDWSPDDSYLASVGLDNVVLIWSGQTFELVRKLDAHLGFVKGLVFDPAGQFLATQADDNSLKVWRTDTWTLHADVREPFEDAPKANVMRPTWSPDGAYVVTPNSMNGPVFCAAVVERHSWKSHNSLIGHPDIVQVAAYNPLIFLRDPAQPASINNSCSLLALCAQGTVSLWFTDLSQPFVVLADVMDREVLDMRWSKDGKQLWLSSSEGHVACIVFSYSEYAPLAPPETQSQIFQTAYGVVPRAKVSVSRPLSAQSSLSTATGAGGGGGTMTQPNTLVARKGPNAKRPRTVQLLQNQPFAPAQPSPLQQAMQVQPQPLVGQQVAPAVNPFANAPTFPAQQQPIQQQQQVVNAFASTSAAQFPQQQQQHPLMQPSVLHHPQHQQQQQQPAQLQPHPAGAAPYVPFGAAVEPSAASMSMSTPTGTGAGAGKKRQQSLAASAESAGAPQGWPYPPPGAFPYPPYGVPYPYPYPPGGAEGYVGAPRASEADYRLQGHTLSRSKDGEGEGREARELVPAYAALEREVTFRVTNGSAGRVGGGASGRGKGKEREREEAVGLAVPSVVSYGRVELEDKEGGDVLEFRNFGEGERKGTAELTVVNEKKDKSLWVDYVPRYVVAAAGGPVFTAVSLDDGSLVAWSPAGRRIIPTLVLDAPCSFLEAEGSYLLALTALGTLSVYNLSPSIPKPRTIYPPLSISPLLASSATRQHPNPTVTTSALLPHGTPLIALSTGATFSYDADLAAWTRLSEPWWARSSEAWEGRRATSARGGHGSFADKNSARGIIRKVESAVNEIVVNELHNGEDGAEDTTDEEDEGEAEAEVEKGKEKEPATSETENQDAAPTAEGGDVEMNGAASSSTSNGKTKASPPAPLPRPAKRLKPTGPPESPTRSSGDFRTAATLAHLETRMQAAVALDSQSEYRAFLVQYAKKLAEEGFRSKAEELARELLGPVYHKPGKSEDEAWTSTVVGLNKRDLLRDVLREFAKSRTTDSLGKEYQDLLKKVSATW
ncbi:hypothetical protein JCM8097_009584 [Rhodosporidiobolus ruineniae]